MRKTRNLIFQNMMLHCTMWKLSSFFSLLLILNSGFLFASENPSPETIVHADVFVESLPTDQPEKPVIYVAEGTVIYGEESISQVIEVKPSVKRETIQKTNPQKNRSIAVLKKITQKVKTQQDVKNSKVSSPIYYSHQSQSSFETSHQQLGIGTLASNHSFKALIIHHDYVVALMQLGDVTPTDKYTFSFTPNTIYFHSFTRPPPFI